MKKGKQHLLVILVFCLIMSFILDADAIEIGFTERAINTGAFNFDIWRGVGDTSVIICDNKTYDNCLYGKLKYDDFKELKYEGNVFGADYYSVIPYEEGVKITLKEDFLKDQKEGCYLFQAIFTDVSVQVELYIVYKETVLSDAIFDFNRWSDNGNAYVVIPSSYNDIKIFPLLFEQLKLDGCIVDRTDYSISSITGATVLMLNGNYIKSLPKGENIFVADYTNVKGIRLRLNNPNPIMPGDIDFDQKVTAADARLSLRLAVELETKDSVSVYAVQAADMDYDGKVSAADARIILRIAVGIKNANDN